jgi:hypothetical protein
MYPEVDCYIIDCIYHDGRECTYNGKVIIDQTGCTTYKDDIYKD